MLSQSTSPTPPSIEPQVPNPEIDPGQEPGRESEENQPPHAPEVVPLPQRTAPEIEPDPGRPEIIPQHSPTIEPGSPPVEVPPLHP